MDQLDLTRDPSGMGMEIAQIIAATPEWESLKEDLQRVLRPGMSKEEVLAVGRVALTKAGLGSDAVFGGEPDELSAMIPPEQREAMAQFIDLYMITSAFADIEQGAPLPFMSIARGYVRTGEQESDGATYRVVMAMATPLDDPELIVAEFAEACYRAFDSSAFAKRSANVRDAEWWRRHVQGESYRQIALDDPRSGLAPEAALNPKEYADEVRRSTDTVRRAAKRFGARWTRFADVVSKESE